MMRASTKRVTTLGFCLLCVMLGSLVYQAEGQEDFPPRCNEKKKTCEACDGSECECICFDQKADNFDIIYYKLGCACQYSGCTDKKADNYNRTATKNDGSCEYSGCKDKKADK